MFALVRVSVPLVFLAATLQSAAAIDQVYRTDGTAAAGTLTEMGRDSVTVNAKVGGDQTVPTNEIDYIDFEGQPADLRLARSALNSGNLEQAIERLAASAKEETSNRDLEKEIAFLQAKAKAMQAQRDPQQAAAAVQALKDFTASGGKHYRFYPALLLLARTQVLAGDATGAKVSYQEAGQSPYEDIKLAATVGQADAAFLAGRMDEAGGLYDQVARKAGTNQLEKSQILAAKLGQAKVAASKGQQDDAITTLDDIIDSSGPEDTRVQAEAYLRQGDAYAAQGKAKNAALSYLHVDVVPALAKESELHAEALYRLNQLWPDLSQPARAAEAAARLQSLYPNSEWAGKLGG